MAQSVVSDQRLERQGLYRGMGDGLTRAFEIAMIPALFGLAGYGLDRLVGTGWVFAAIFAIVALFGVVMRIWYAYQAQMAAIAETAPWTEKTPEERVRG